MIDSKVTIVCTSYNYGQYISHALDSFLQQKTNFTFDILVVDDCSTDNSMEILKDYVERYPDKIRVVQNPQNQGLTRTWIAICKEVTAKYIARCDADDYWIDEYKLQKQYDLLESNPDSKWCNTDFNIVDENDVVVYEKVFQNGPIPYANTYAKMLATKGMTLPSSWMVETQLMQEVNDLIDPNSVDDGFPMQLEFFNRTELTFVPDATVAYRMTSDSDSRPVSPEKMEYRINGLKETQLSYLKKYPNKDIQEIAILQVEREAQQELRVFALRSEVNKLMEINQNHSQTIKNQHDVIENQTVEIQQIRENLAEIIAEKEEILHQYNTVISSCRWVFTTKLINLFRRKK